MRRDELDRFRELHRAASTGQLAPSESANYADAVTRLFENLTAAQNGSPAPRHVPRRAARCRRAFPVEVAWGRQDFRGVTQDIGIGGFAMLLGTSPPRNTAVLVRLLLTRDEQMVLFARAVGARDRFGATRVSFAFEELTDAERARLERCLVDDALREMALSPARGR